MPERWGPAPRVFAVANSATARRGLELVIRDALTASLAFAGAGGWGDPLAAGSELVLAEWEESDSLTLVPLDGPPIWVVLIDDPRPSWLGDALRGAIRGVLRRDAGNEQIAAALIAASLGLATLEPAYLNLLTSSPAGSRPASSSDTTLTSREREILILIADGLANKEIALHLHISEHTVKFHLGSLFNKLAVNGRAEAVAAGIKRGFVLL